jgi:hypothetical protein
MQRLLLLFVVITNSSIAYAADKIMWAPSGDWKILTSTSQKVNLNDTLYATQGGKVGIGVLAPSLKLEVSGTVKATAAQVDTISNTAGTGAVTFSQGLTVTSGKVLKADSIQTTSGSPPQGFVPIGGMVAVMPTTHANAWQPPASGAIKDGFMRADGGTVPTCTDCIIPAGTALPDMRQRYPKGSNTGTSGATGGANTLVGHYHGMGTGATLNITSSGGTTVTGSIGEDGGHSHTVPQKYRDAADGHNHGSSNGYLAQAGNSSGWIAYTGLTVSGSGTHVHGFSLSAPSHTHPAGNFGGAIGLVTGGLDGNGSVNNEPSYMEVVWVIRVK